MLVLLKGELCCKSNIFWNPYCYRDFGVPQMVQNDHLESYSGGQVKVTLVSKLWVEKWPPKAQTAK